MSKKLRQLTAAVSASSCEILLLIITLYVSFVIFLKLCLHLITLHLSVAPVHVT